MEWNRKDPLIILIAGKARSGKGTIARYLKESLEAHGQKVVISPYTKYLKQYIEDITGEVITEDHKPREMLQKLSSELIKKELGKEDFFIQRQIEDLLVYSYFMDVVIIPDVRFPKEIEVVRKYFSNVVSIGVIRKGFISDLTEEQKQDVTEIALDGYKDYDYRIINTNYKKLGEDTLKVSQDIQERRYRYE